MKNESIVQYLQSLNISSTPDFRKRITESKTEKEIKSLVSNELNKNMLNALIQADDSVKPRTLKSYWSRLKTLYFAMFNSIWDGRNFIWLNDYVKVLKFINDKSDWRDTTKWNYINSIASIISRIQGFEELHKIYSEVNIKKLGLYQSQREKNVLNANQKKNIISWKKILDADLSKLNNKSKLIIELIKFIPRRSGTYRTMTWNDKDSDDNYFLIKDGVVQEMVLNN